MRGLLLLAALLGGAAFAQDNKCQSKCVGSDACQSCSDDRCMKRCQVRLQTCMTDCEKNDPEASKQKKVKLNGTCPGPNGRVIPCDQIATKAPSDEEIKNMMAHPATKQRNKEKDEANVPHVMPTADNYQQLYNQYQKQKQH